MRRQTTHRFAEESVLQCKVLLFKAGCWGSDGQSHLPKADFSVVVPHGLKRARGQRLLSLVSLYFVLLRALWKRKAELLSQRSRGQAVTPDHEVLDGESIHVTIMAAVPRQHLY